MRGTLRNTDLQTDPGRVASALALGSLVGGGLLLIGIFGWLIASSPGIDPQAQNNQAGGSLWFMALFFMTWGFGVAVVGYAIGLVLLAGPLWWLLHSAGLRGWLAAVLLGGGLTLLVSLVLPIGMGDVYFVATGMVVGLLVWRVAYGGRLG